MTNGSWLTLTDYSNKHKVSLSTLRRRIKADEIKYRFSEGKYFISDEPVSTHQRSHRPSQGTQDLGSMVSTHKEKPFTQKTNVIDEANKKENLNSKVSFQNKIDSLATQSKQEEPILSAASKLLVELKKAYMVILQEKEEQIIHLKSEISDLKTLVKVLESENQRLRK